MKTLNLTLATSLLTLALGGSAFAETKLETAVLKTLVTHSGEITLIDSDGKAMGADYQLPSLITGSLMSGYLSNGGKDWMTLSNTATSCEKKSAAKGVERWDCTVSFNNGDFTVEKDGKLVGPETESSVFFTVPVEKSAHQIRLLSKKIRADLAG